MSLSLTSSAFENGESIPMHFTCDGDRKKNPPLAISGVPDGAESLALLVDDPDVPKEIRADGVFDHWVLFNIPTNITHIEEGGSVGYEGVNGRGELAYTGPCPPKEYEPSEHRYFFRLYALDTMLDLEEGVTKADVIAAMEGHVIEKAELMGKYKKQ